MTRRFIASTWHTTAIVVFTFFAALTTAVTGQEPLKAPTQTSYTAGQAIPVSCLNRTIDTGEHVVDSKGELQYIPFPTCSETGKPLELYFGVEKEINCTISFIEDSLFHLLEFYVHNDAPLTCRIPTRPLPPSSQFTVPDPSTKVGALGTQSTLYTPLLIALSGTLQLSHLHIANNLNLLVHAAPKSVAPGTIDAATAYSISSASRSTRVVNGDSLTLSFSVRWYPSPSLPSGWRGYGGHLGHWTLLYCLLSAGAATAICVAYFRGVELPKRLRGYAKDKLTGGEGRFGVGSGYGYSGGAAGNGYGYSGYGYGVGKKD